MNLDPNTIQRFLFTNCDTISNGIRALKPNNYIVKDMPGPLGASDNFIYLHKDGKQASLTKEEGAKILFRQRELLTNSTITSTEAAIDLFKNAARPNGTIDLTYTISHLFYITLPEGLFYFNVDEVNALNEGKFFISKVVIENKSKDAFTSRSNYEIRLKINYTFFDDLLDENLTLKSVDGKYSVKYSLIKILYPNFSKSGNTNTNITKESRGVDGLLLVQALNMPTDIQQKYFDSIKKDLVGSKLQRNFHLTFKNHVINVFSSNDPIYKRYENELDITYISFEADSNKNIGSDEKTPKINDDLYSLLAKANLNNERYKNLQLGPLFEQIKKINEDIAKLQKNINCVRFYENTTEENKKKLTNLEKSSGSINLAEQRTEVLRDQIEKIKILIKQIMLIYILDNCQFYELLVPLEKLSDYRTLENFEAFKRNFNTERFALAVGIGAAAGGWGALATGTADILFQLEEASQNNLALYEKANLRLSSTNLRINPISKDNILGEISSLREITISTLQQNLSNITTKESETIKKVQGELAKAGQKEIKSGGETYPVYFTTFGQIIKFLNKFVPNVYICSGGNTVTYDGAGNNNFFNYLDVPIAFNKFTEFFSKEILEADSLAISTEVLIRNAVERLLKGAIKLDSKTTSTVLKEIVPTRLNFTTTIHSNDAFIKSGAVDLLNDDTFKNARINLRKSSIIRPEDKTLYKLFFISGEEEIKYFNFYDSYKLWPQRNINSALNFSSREFQDYIIQEHNMPCILLNPVAMEETILKQKQVVFSRLDNPNLALGNVIDNDVTSLFRLPYELSGQFKPYMAFFLDIASFLFVAPPYSQKETSVNTFGYGGLYMVTKSNFEYDFQRIVSGKPTVPNFDAKLSLSARRISDGTSVKPQEIVKKKDTQLEDCKDVQPITEEPATAEQKELRRELSYSNPTSKL